MADTQQTIQSSQYDFPYHHVPFLDARGSPRRVRTVDWGLEYLCYINHLVARIEQLKPKSLLDVGCGDGLLISRLRGKVPTLVGVDMDERALLFAKAFTPSAAFRAADVATVEEEFDLVTMIEVLEHIPDGHDLGFLSACGARVRPGGTMIVSVPTVNQPLNPKHYRHYEHKRLEADLSAALPKFEIASMRYFYKGTRAEALYKKLVKCGLVHGDISVLRNALWKHVTGAAAKADATTGLHLIAELRRTA